MPDFLEQVHGIKEAEIQRLKDDPALAALLDERPSARHSFLHALKKPGLSIIAEIKTYSPSRGEIRSLPSIAPMARAFESAGARALSILTDSTHFHGRLEDVSEAAAGVSIPVLRKDFLLHPLQIVESRRAGAHAILLIAAFAGVELKNLHDIAATQGLDALVEVHTEAELERAVEAGAAIIGVNNRDLRTLEVDLRTCGRLVPRIPKDVIRVAESGFSSKEDLVRAKGMGFDAVLIGTALMTAPDPAAKLRELADVR